MTGRRFIDRLYNLLTLRPVYHGLFWLILLTILVVTGLEQVDDFAFVFTNEIISLFFYAVLVYFNLFYLIPRYLAKNVLLYLGLVLAACALVSPIWILVLYLKLSGQPFYQGNLVKDQGMLFLGSFLVTILSTVLRVITDWWRYQREKQLLTTQSIQTELRFLKSQINPHFLFNTLNNLYALTLKKSDKAPEIVLKLSEIMRYMLYECNEKRVLLTKEIQYIHNYLDLERLRQTGASDIRFTSEGKISDQMIDRVAETLQRITWNRDDVRGFLGAYLTEPKPHVFFDSPEEPLEHDEFVQICTKHGYRLDARSLLLFADSHLFINGEPVPVDADDLVILQALADNRRIDTISSLSEEGIALIYDWYCCGFAHPSKNLME